MAERSKALVLGTSLFGGVGSNPTAATDFECIDWQIYNIGTSKHTVYSLQSRFVASSPVLSSLHPLPVCGQHLFLLTWCDQKPEQSLGWLL